MENRLPTRLSAWLLTLVMLLSLVPAMGLTASAADTSWTTVNTYDQLKAALSTQNPPDNIKLGCDIDTGELNSSMGILETLEVKGRKQLDLNGHTLRMYSAKTAMSDMITIRHGDLTVLDSSSKQNGTILGSTYNDSCYLINVHTYGKFTLNSGTLKVDAGSLSGKTRWKRVIYCYAGGTVTINGGTLHVAPETYEGKNNAYGQYFEEEYSDQLNGHCGYTLMAANSCKVSINGGTFQGPVRLDAGGSDWKQNVPRVWITGGTFEKKVMLNGPGDGTRPLTLIRGGVFLDYVQAWAAASFAEENPFTASEVTVNGGEFHDTFWIRPTFPSSDIVSGGERRGYHLSAKLMNATIHKCLTADPDISDLYKVYVGGKRDSSQKTEEDIYQLVCEVLGRSAVKNGNGVFPVLNKKNYRSIFGYRNTGNPKTEGYIFEFRAFNQKPTTFYNQAWGFQKAELDGSEITMGSLRDGVTFGGGVPTYTVNTSGMRTINFYWYDLPQVMKDNNYRCEATCEVNGKVVTLAKTTNPTTRVIKGSYTIPNSSPTTSAQKLTFQVRLEWYNGSTWELADSNSCADMYLLKYNVEKDSTIPIETVLLDMVNGDLLATDPADANPIRKNAMDVRCEKVVRQVNWADNGDYRNKTVVLEARAGFRFTRDTRFVVKNAGSVTASWLYTTDGGETCVIGIEAQECTLLPTVQGTLKNFYMGRQMGEAYITADSPAGCTFEIFKYACLGEATDEWEPIDDDSDYYEYYFYIVPPSGYAVRPGSTQVDIIITGGYWADGTKSSDYKREARYDDWMTNNSSHYSYGYSWSIGRPEYTGESLFPEYERTTRTLYLTIKEPVAGENPNTDSSYQVIDGLPADVKWDKFEWNMDKDTVFQAGKEYILDLQLLVPKEDADGVWAEDPDYITVYINGVNCTKYNAWQGFWSGTENCEWGISERWLTPIPGDIQTVRIKVEEPVAGQPLNFHVRSLGEPEAYMAGAYPYAGEQYDAFWFDTTGGRFDQLNPGAVARSDGGTYRLMVFVHPKEGYQFAKATEETRTFWVNGQKAKGSCKADGSQAQVDYTFTFPAAKPGAGVKVSGKITSYNPGNATTIQLKQGDTVKYTATIDPTTGSGQKEQSFSFDTVAAGTYDLVVTKPGHLTYTVKNVVVENDPLDLTKPSNAAIRNITLLCGDIDGNGFINSTDLGIILKGQNYGKSTATAGDKAADLDGNGYINSTDLGIVLQGQHYGKSAVSVGFAG